MANHVDNYVEIICDSSIKLSKYFPKDKETDEYVDIEQLPWMPVKPEEQSDYDWYCENVGAKWCYAEDEWDNSMTFISAWSPCIAMLEYLVCAIAKDDETVEIRHHYTDEFYNYFGVAKYTYEDGAVFNHSEQDWDLVKDHFMNKYQCDITHDDFDWWEEQEFGNPLEIQDDFIANWRDEEWEQL